MSKIINFNLTIGGVLTDATSVKLSDPTGTFGVKRDDTGAVVVADGVDMTHIAVGKYQYTFAEPAAGLTYTYWVEWVYLGNTYRIEQDLESTVSAAAVITPGVVTSGCDGQYAEAWQFASFWCVSSLVSRVDDSGVNGKLYLQDSQIDFLEEGIKANVGMILYNLSDGSNGPVTAVETNRLTATLGSGTDNLWDDGDQYRIVPIDAREIATMNRYLEVAASDIHAALAATGMCECTWASWALAYVQKLNIIDAAAYYRCPCGKPDMTDEARASYLEWMTQQLDNLRTGKVDLCSGATGAEFPVIDWAEQGVTDFAKARIILNSQLRG